MSSKISALTPGTPLGTDVYPITPLAGVDVVGGNRKITHNDLAAFIISALYEDSAIKVDAATTANLAAFTYANGASGIGATITINANGAFPSQDGVTSVAGKKYLVKNASNPIHRGVYTLTTLGTGGTQAVLTRATDSDTPAELDGQVVIVAGGTVNARKIFNQTTVLPTIGTNNIVYSATPAASNAPLNRTEAQMDTLVAASGLTAGRYYNITDAMNASVTASVVLLAVSSNQLAKRGTGSLQNPNMDGPVWGDMNYELLTHKITSFYEQINNNYGAGNTVAVFPFDNGSYTGNILYDISVVSTFAPSVFVNNFAYQGAILSIPGTDTDIQNNILGPGSVTTVGTLSDTGTLAGVHNYGTLYLGDHANVSGTIVEVNVVLDLLAQPASYTLVGGIFGIKTDEITGLTAAGALSIRMDAAGSFQITPGLSDPLLSISAVSGNVDLGDAPGGFGSVYLSMAQAAHSLDLVATHLKLNLATYADNTAALGGGLVAGDTYANSVTGIVTVVL